MPLSVVDWNRGETGPALTGTVVDGDKSLLHSTATIRAITNAIARVTHANIFGSPGTVDKGTDIGYRVDRQNSDGTCVNVSIQKNDVGAPSTVASVMVPTRYNLAFTVGADRTIFDARNQELQRKVRQGLIDSMNTYAVVRTKKGDATTDRTIMRKGVAGEFSNA